MKVSKLQENPPALENINFFSQFIFAVLDPSRPKSMRIRIPKAKFYKEKCSRSRFLPYYNQFVIKVGL